MNEILDALRRNGTERCRNQTRPKIRTVIPPAETIEGENNLAFVRRKRTVNVRTLTQKASHDCNRPAAPQAGTQPDCVAPASGMLANADFHNHDGQRFGIHATARIVAALSGTTRNITTTATTATATEFDGVTYIFRRVRDPRQANAADRRQNVDHQRLPDSRQRLLRMVRAAHHTPRNGAEFAGRKFRPSVSGTDGYRTRNAADFVGRFLRVFTEELSTEDRRQQTEKSENHLATPAHRTAHQKTRPGAANQTDPEATKNRDLQNAAHTSQQRGNRPPVNFRRRARRPIDLAELRNWIFRALAILVERDCRSDRPRLPARRHLATRSETRKRPALVRSFYVALATHHRRRIRTTASRLAIRMDRQAHEQDRRNADRTHEPASAIFSRGLQRTGQKPRFPNPVQRQILRPRVRQNPHTRRVAARLTVRRSPVRVTAKNRECFMAKIGEPRRVQSHALPRRRPAGRAIVERDRNPLRRRRHPATNRRGISRAARVAPFTAALLILQERDKSSQLLPARTGTRRDSSAVPTGRKGFHGDGAPAGFTHAPASPDRKANNVHR